MSSTIFYRFRSQKNTARIQFDGTGITVFDLKKEIIAENRLGDGTAFELRVYNADTEEEYSDDTLVVPRSSSVVARRSPPNRPGKGGASRYVTGKPRITRVTLNNASSSNNKSMAPTAPAEGTMTEEERIALMFNNQSDQWKQTQQDMASAAPVYTAKPQQSSSSATSNNPDDIPPPGYMCYRCGSKEHWIKNCPTNDDPNWEGKRIKRTTGIPKTYLQTVANPDDDPTKTYLMNEEGQYVVQVADSKAWDAYNKKVNKSSELDSLKDVDPELLDPITGKVMVDPVITPCCSKVYSRASIEDSLLESDFVCPNCGQVDIFLDQLQSDVEKKKVIDELLEQELKKKGKRSSEEDADENGNKRLQTNPVTLAVPSQLPPMPIMPNMPTMPGFMPFMPQPPPPPPAV